jgi:hypothetical protein
MAAAPCSREVLQLLVDGRESERDTERECVQEPGITFKCTLPMTYFFQLGPTS